MKKYSILFIAALVFGIGFHATVSRVLTYSDSPHIGSSENTTFPDTTPPKTTKTPQSTSTPETDTIVRHTPVSGSQPEDILSARPSQTPITNAPKQAEIRDTVAREYTYYPLLVPDDPGYAMASWAFTQVNAQNAWNITTGTNETTVAVIDSGFSLDHEDLQGRWAINSGESGSTTGGDRCWTGVAANKQSNNCDDDNNGYIDDWRGWNFYLGDNNVMPGRTNPNGLGVSHGTETAGLAGASGNNGLGGATLAWNTQIMPLQVLSDDGPGYTSDVTAAIYYAVDNGADVINLSLGGSEFDPALAAATDYAFNNDVVVVAAAGNCGSGGSGCESQPAGALSYPALNRHVISVGATNSSANRASFSSYGPSLDVSAPGSGTIVTPTWDATNTTSLYATTLYGTSYASPQVASMAALIKAIRPSSTASDIEALILATASKPVGMNGAMHTPTFGHGIIDTAKSITVAQSLNSASSVPTLGQVGGVVSEHSFSSSDSIGSGCTAASSSYCTIRFRDDNKGHDRYLPYKATNVSGQAGWIWPGTFLGAGAWKTQAVHGDNESTSPYLLFQK